MSIPAINQLKAKRLGIDTQWEYVIYLNANCSICRSEGLESLTRIQVFYKNTSIIATLNVLRGNTFLTEQEAGLSESAWKKLGMLEGEILEIKHLQPVASMRHVRSKIFGQPLSESALDEIIQDITIGRYSSIQLAAFVTACSDDHLSVEEIISLTNAMIQVGQRLDWNNPIVADKHCVGGLPGNRTSPIIVAIIAAAGLTMPKTSSRAITSPSGTADTMETITNVSLDIPEIKKVVATEGGCLAWGGAVQLSPADDLIIKIEKALDIDGEGQLVASVLSKKVAAGSTHVVIDIPVGPTAKVRTEANAQKLKYLFTVVGKAIGLTTKVIITDGSQPVGYGIGPVPEAQDVLAVLRNEATAPTDLRERALLLAGAILELVDATQNGKAYAQQLLDSGEAYKKFKQICLAQGRFSEPKLSPYTHLIKSKQTGLLTAIDNRRLAMVAKLCGAPSDLGAGIRLHVKVGDTIQIGQPLYTMYSDTQGEINYTLDYIEEQADIFRIE